MIGSDFELPLLSKKGLYVPAHFFTEGTKDEPERTTHGYIQWDNAMAEMNTAPHNLAADFVYNVNAVIGDFHEKSGQRDCFVDFIDAATYDDAFLSMPELSVLGCEPDFNAWTERQNEAPIGLLDSRFRTAGFHLHVDTFHGPRLVQVLDTYALLPLLKHEKAAVINRRDWYGGAGAYREKSYGIEWRTPSSSLLGNSDMLAELFERTVECEDRFEELYSEIALRQLGAIVPNIINTRNLEAAEKLCKELGIEV